MKRRHFLSGAAAASLFGIIPSGRTREAQTGVRNVIFLVSDGMSSGVLPLAEMLSVQSRAKKTEWANCLDLPGAARGLMDMASLNSPVTDSAAASSAWGAGSRVFNGRINVLPDDRKLKSLFELAGESGRSTGLVTTATVTHATPAGFAAQVANRRDEEAIAAQYLGRVDVILGGGTPFFSPQFREDKRDLAGEFAEAGFSVCRNRTELQSAASRKVLGLFADGFMPYSIDRNASSELRESSPGLVEMMSAALERLSGNQTGFVLQVEAARVDHAAHANDIGALLWDQLEFDNAIGVARAFADNHPDTLVVVCTDHGNANPGLNGLGSGYGGSGSFFHRVADARESFEHLLMLEGNPAEWSTDEIRSRLQKGFGWDLEVDEAEALRAAIQGDGVSSWNRQLANPFGLLGEIGGRRNGVGWCGTSHTADWAELFALGTGAQQFAGHFPGTAVFEKLTSLMGIDFKNPSMTSDEASSYPSGTNFGSVNGSPPKIPRPKA